MDAQVHRDFIEPVLPQFDRPECRIDRSIREHRRERRTRRLNSVHEQRNSTPRDPSSVRALDLERRSFLRRNEEPSTRRNIVERQSALQPDCSPVSTPMPVSGVPNKARADWIEIDVADKALHVSGPIDDDRSESPLPDVTQFPVPLVPRDGVQPMEPLHSGGEIRVRQSQHEMMVVRHQHPVDDLPLEPASNLLEQVDEVSLVVIRPEYGAPRAPSPVDVKDRPHRRPSSPACHAETFALRHARIRTSIATLSPDCVSDPHTVAPTPHVSPAERTQGVRPF